MSELYSIYQDNLNIIFTKITRLLTNLNNLPTGKNSCLIFRQI